MLVVSSVTVPSRHFSIGSSKSITRHSRLSSAGQGKELPGYVQRQFEDYLKCGLLEHGSLCVKCDGCMHEHLVASSCKRRGFCPSYGARRMLESAAHLVDHVFANAPVRQRVLSLRIEDIDAPSFTRTEDYPHRGLP